MSSRLDIQARHIVLLVFIDVAEARKNYSGYLLIDSKGKRKVLGVAA